jgi:cysteinyl-tRNA synthetase
MATKYLGETFDIHGGGLENIFPHNECEIAQSEAVTGKQLARYWVLAGTLLVNGVKMSKSLGNFLTIKEALKLYTPEAIRFFILSSHYRSPLDFSRDAMLAAQRGVERLHHTVRTLRAQMETAMHSGTADLSYISEIDPHRNAFVEAMNDDFNTPQAIATLFDFSRQVNTLLASGQRVSRGTLSVIDGFYREFGGQVLGIIPGDLAKDVTSKLISGLMDIIMDIRQQYRAAQDWDRADELRHLLSDLGITIEDRSEGPTWRVESRK